MQSRDNKEVINNAPKYRLRRLVSLLILTIIISLVVSLIYLFNRQDSSAQLPAEPRMPPVSSQGFDETNLISDSEFTRWNSLSSEQIQAFITDWGYGCRSGKAEKMPKDTGIYNPASGGDKQSQSVPCLKDYRGVLAAHDADRFCPRAVQGGENLTAGQIIAQVSRACGINPKAILVTLQKEQGLITASSTRLTPRRYQIAMGYACPDHKACDSQFYGFGTQVYYAARQWRRYQLNPQDYDVAAGQAVTLGFGPDSRCGSKKIVPQNWATAALYNYTPYLPSSDALAGLNDECAQPGNLNFYQFYKAWFGDPIKGGGQVLTRKALAAQQSPPASTK